MLLCGDALEQLKTLKSGSCRTIVTSPPYYGLRDYGLPEQIGLERTPEEYIQRLVEVFREGHRVLADDGTLWVNIADSYAGSWRGVWANTEAPKETYHRVPGCAESKVPNRWEGIKPKDLIGIPWMLAFALRADGWYLRQDIIWSKPNAMPESVKDRCTKSHEYLFLFSKSPRYYFDHEAIREPRTSVEDRRTFRGGGAYTGNMAFNNHADIPNASVGNKLIGGSRGAFGPQQSRKRGSGNKERVTRPTPDVHLGGNIPYTGEDGLRSRRSVWNVATAQNKIAHFATFPPELIRPCVLAGSAPGDTVCDPFCGSGTTGVVAAQEGRAFIGIDANPDYVRMSETRIRLEGHKQLEWVSGEETE